MCEVCVCEDSSKTITKTNEKIKLKNSFKVIGLSDGCILFEGSLN